MMRNENVISIHVKFITGHEFNYKISIHKIIIIVLHDCQHCKNKYFKQL